MSIKRCLRLQEDGISLTDTPDGYIVAVAGNIPRKGIKAGPDRFRQTIDREKNREKRKRGGTAYGTDAGAEEAGGCSMLLWERKA